MKKPLKQPLLLSVLLASSSLSAAPIYINEFHYDNLGSDKNEFVEIAGESGLSLDGWSLEFYNGSNQRRYMTWNLSGNFDDQQLGHGVLAFTGSGGIQNGVNDGIALVNPIGELVQFISYEGQLLAANGAAQGTTSIDVGVAETPSTPIGSSLQLSGTADTSEGFVWVLGQASFGHFNADQYYLAPTTVIQQPLTSVSEPASLSLLGLVVLALGRVRQRSARKG
jgi:hypothetical protein